ncbi:fork head domain-containing protein, partial [Blastocladiella britannica]
MLERPPYPLSTVLAYGIATSRSQRLTLQELYAWMLVTYPYYQTAKTNWRNTVRHTLSTNPAFVKIDKQLHEFGKGAFWMLDPARVD